MSKAIPETELLKPRDPSLDDNTDEWPEFTLTNVYIHQPGNHDTSASLLEACAGYPVTVTGQLQPLDDEDAHLYLQPPSKKRVNVVLENVYTFSYGQYGDGSTAIWAAGKAGWYTLKPGRNYQDIYDGMVEAVNLLYFVADAYRTPRKKGKGKTAEVLPDYTATELFEKYAVEELGSSDPADGQDMIYRHKEFVIASMLSGKEGLSWSKYPLTKHLKLKFPDATAEIRRRLSKPLAVDQSKKPTAANTRQTRQGSVDTAASSISAGSRTKSKRGQSRREPVELITIDSDSGTSTANTNSLQEARSKDDRKPRKNEVPTKSRSTRRHAAEEEPSPEPEEQLATPTKEEDTDEETRLRARKNKSSLRPRASKAAKSAGKGGKGPASQEADDAEDNLPSSPTGGKRKYLDSPDSRRQPPKRHNSRTHMDEGIDMPTSPSASGDGDEDSSDPVGEMSNLALRDLAHRPDPVQEDTWVCALDGCSHKVYAASHPDSQRLIKEHYKLHAFDDDERVQMVKKLQAPSLPAGHLMERVKQQAMAEGFPGSRQMASRYPTTMPGNPVVQKY